MVAPGLAHGVIILSRRPCCIFVQSSLRIPRTLAVVCLFVLAACTPAGGGSSSGNRIVTPAAAAKPSGARTTPTPVDTSAPAPASSSSASTSARLRGESLSSTDLYTAYRAILETYVYPGVNTQLSRAAADGLRQGLPLQ